jgi:hypothetical protein
MSTDEPRIAIEGNGNVPTPESSDHDDRLAILSESVPPFLCYFIFLLYIYFKLS